MTSKAACGIAGFLFASTLVLAQAPPQAPAIAQSPPELSAPDIPGVIKGGTKVQLIRAGFNGAEGPISMPDGSLLFTEYDANRIIKIDNAGNISTYLEDTNRTIGLAYDSNGRLFGTESRVPRLGMLHPTRRVLADSFDGQPLVHPNDLVIDRKGGIYFTDQIPGPQSANWFREPPPGRKPLLFYITPEGKLTKVTEHLTNPNGVQLSPDEKILYATNGQNIVAFDVQHDGSVTNPRNFVASGGDGLAVDTAGRLYSAVGAVQGVRVFSPRGEDLGTIPVGVNPQSVAFAGPEKKTLYIVGRGAVYKVAMLAEGIRSRAK